MEKTTCPQEPTFCPQEPTQSKGPTSWKLGTRIKTIHPITLAFGRVKRGANGIFLGVTHGYAYDYAKVALEEPYNKIEWFKFEEIEAISDEEYARQALQEV